MITLWLTLSAGIILGFLLHRVGWKRMILWSHKSANKRPGLKRARFFLEEEKLVCDNPEVGDDGQIMFPEEFVIDVMDKYAQYERMRLWLQMSDEDVIPEK